MPFSFFLTAVGFGSSPRPPLTFSILCRFFLLALIGFVEFKRISPIMKYILALLDILDEKWGWMRTNCPWFLALQMLCSNIWICGCPVQFPHTWHGHVKPCSGVHLHPRRHFQVFLLPLKTDKLHPMCLNSIVFSCLGYLFCLDLLLQPRKVLLSSR